ncbi:MAG TPA: CapA family protein [Candidatus Limnocylindrales bacterium]|nr:CapA family protein [Candidatus Limnocylindrales bacterium]
MPPAPRPIAPQALLPPVVTVALVASAEDPSPSLDPSPATTPPAPSEPVLVPLVPVTGFWSTERSITRAGLAAALAGTGSSPRRVLVSAADLPSLAASLGVRPGSNVRSLTPADVRAGIAAAPGALGILRAEHVTPAVRALAVGGTTLFGGGRVRDLAAWPLLVAEPAGAAPSGFVPSGSWTIVAGGDVMLDRYVYRRLVIEGMGANHAWNGGLAKITSRYCCGYPGFHIVKGVRTSANHAVRSLLRGADVSMVNLEGPAPDDFRYHTSGYIFSMDPDLLTGLRYAGVDVVSLANNHIRNWGASGIRDTIRNLDALGIRHAGAGRTTTQARRPAWMTAAGQRVAILAYNGVGTYRGIGGSPNATATRAGAAALSMTAVRADIKAARAAGADVVIVFPHWGAEYTDRLDGQQADLAPRILAAGADAVIGGHSHWAGPIRLVGNRLVVYSMGNLVFSLSHDARTQQGLLVELTFTGKQLAQVTLHPTLEVGSVQPNILTPAGGGTALLAAIQRASARLGGP